jgi:DNA-binding MarR family transcriptional regulator
MSHCIRPMGTVDPEWLFRDLHMAHRLAVQSVFSRDGVGDLGQPLILLILDDYGSSGETPTQKELADSLNISPATVTMSLKSLERKGYIRKITDDADLRCNRVEITNTGRETAEKCRRAFNEIDKAMYHGFSEDEKMLISGLYARMIENLMDLTNSVKAQGEGGETR